MPYSIKIDKLNLDIPSSLDEFTIGQFIELRKLPTDKDVSAEILSIFTKANIEEIRSIRYNKTNEIKVQEALQLCNHIAQEIKEFNKSIKKFEVPKTVIVLDHTIKIPDDLEKEPYWPSRKVKEVMLKTIEAENNGKEFDFTDDIPEIIAHYLYKPWTGSDYDEYKADEFIVAINDMKFKEAISLGNFFILRWRKLFLKNSSLWRTNLHLIKLKLKSKGLAFLETLRRLTPWLMVICLNGIK